MSLPYREHWTSRDLPIDTAPASIDLPCSIGNHSDWNSDTNGSLHGSPTLSQIDIENAKLFLGGEVNKTGGLSAKGHSTHFGLHVAP
jgi:hypothetical protein